MSYIGMVFDALNLALVGLVGVKLTLRGISALARYNRSKGGDH